MIENLSLYIIFYSSITFHVGNGNYIAYIAIQLPCRLSTLGMDSTDGIRNALLPRHGAGLKGP